MKFTLTLIASIGVIILTASCQRQSRSKQPDTSKALKRIEERNEAAKDKAMQGIVPEPKPAKDVIFH